MWISVDDFCFLSKASIPNLNLHKNTPNSRGLQKMTCGRPRENLPKPRNRLTVDRFNKFCLNPQQYYLSFDLCRPSFLAVQTRRIRVPSRCAQKLEAADAPETNHHPKKRNPNKISAKRLATITSYHLRRWVLARTVLFGE